MARAILVYNTPAEKPCSKCKRVLPAAMFNKAKWLSTGLRPDCKDCYSAWKKEWWARQPKSDQARRNAENRRLAKRGLRRCVTCSNIRPATDEYWSRVNTGHLNSTCRPCDRARVRQWMDENPERRKANAATGWANRHARKKRRTIPLSSEHRKQIKAVYAECRRRNEARPRAWHVDHIIPLAGKNVCGLHVPWNLRIIPARENIRKSNREDAARS